MADTFQSYLQLSAGVPLLTAFLLGLFSALNPCQLAINISALTSLGAKSPAHNPQRAALTYLAGRFATFLLLGWLCIGVLRMGWGMTARWQTQMMAWTELLETVLPYLLIAIGIFFLIRSFRHEHHHDSCHNSPAIIRRDLHWGAFLLGMLLAFLFCPESAVFFFGMMLPVGVASAYPLLVPVLYGVGAILPLVVLVWLMRFARTTLQNYEQLMSRVQRWVNFFTALLFIVLGVWVMVAES